MNIFPLSLLLLLFAIPIISQADESFDDTIFVVDEFGSPDDIINIIELPANTNDTAKNNSSQGLANANKNKGRKFGLDMAEDARTKKSAEKIKKNTPNGKGLGRPDDKPNPKK